MKLLAALLVLTGLSSAAMARNLICTDNSDSTNSYQAIFSDGFQQPYRTPVTFISIRKVQATREATLEGNWQVGSSRGFNTADLGTALLSPSIDAQKQISFSLTQLDLRTRQTTGATQYFSCVDTQDTFSSDEQN